MEEKRIGGMQKRIWRGEKKGMGEKAEFGMNVLQVLG